MRPRPLLFATFFFFLFSVATIIADDGNARYASPYMVGCILAASMAAACVKEDD